MLTELAVHVIAPLVLLDARVALGALLGVGQDPVGRLALVHALGGPLGQLRAAGRVVRLLAATETKRIRARATHCGYARPHRHLVTSRSRTIAHGLAPFDEVARHEHVVPVRHGRLQQLVEVAARHRLRALVLGTVCAYARRAFTHLVLEVLGIARSAELVVASETQ